MTEIVLKQLSFSNMFSYGSNNSIALDKNRITQLTASNGSGKSSIALILQELLYSKNIKGIKKGDIINRYIKDKNWQGTLNFSVDSVDYELSVKRSGASTKVELLPNKQAKSRRDRDNEIKCVIDDCVCVSIIIAR